MQAPRRGWRAACGAATLAAVKSLNVIVGENIRRARKRAGLSQAQLAAAIGCQQPLVSRIETGVVSCTLEVLYAVSRATHASPAVLLPAPADDWRFRVAASLWADSTDHARVLIAAGAEMLDRLCGPVAELALTDDDSLPPAPGAPLDLE